MTKRVMICCLTATGSRIQTHQNHQRNQCKKKCGCNHEHDYQLFTLSGCHQWSRLLMLFVCWKCCSEINKRKKLQSQFDRRDTTLSYLNLFVVNVNTQHCHLIETIRQQPTRMNTFIRILHTRYDCVICSGRLTSLDRLASLWRTKRHPICRAVQMPMDSGNHCGMFGWIDSLCDLWCQLWCRTFSHFHGAHDGFAEIVWTFRMDLRVRRAIWTVYGVTFWSQI